MEFWFLGKGFFSEEDFYFLKTRIGVLVFGNTIFFRKKIFIFKNKNWSFGFWEHDFFFQKIFIFNNKKIISINHNFSAIYK
jgi:hypothetical protein